MASLDCFVMNKICPDFEWSKQDGCQIMAAILLLAFKIGTFVSGF
jgi:hypothetical protein